MLQPIYLVASGDMRPAANQECEPAQAAMEKRIVFAIEGLGGTVKRAHPYDPVKKHGFIDSQHYGIDVFHSIPPNNPVIVAEAVWQYSHHVLAGLLWHKGPILTIANWSGEWPGLVGLLNLNACMAKAGLRYSSLWSEDFTDKFFLGGLKHWLKTESVTHKTTHTVPYSLIKINDKDRRHGRRFANQFVQRKAILGVFDEGCMGMYNAIIPDEYLHGIGIFKERLSQSTLYAKMLTVKDDEARGVYKWLAAKGMKFNLGKDEATELTEHQVLEQCKMYIAAVRLADEFDCDAIGIQYQQGLKDLTPASDLAEGLLNNVDRPSVYHETSGKELFKGEAIPHFNEVDECAGVDSLITYRIWKELGFSPENTLHDLRWGRWYKGDGIDDFVWVLEISGAAPPAHFIDGYRGATSERQPPMYFRLGGGTIKGISKPGYVVWSRIFIERGLMYYDTGIGEVVQLPEKETEERWRLTTPQWPIMHLVLRGITRDEMMARHMSNHIQVVYAPDFASAKRGMQVKATTMHSLGFIVNYAGDFWTDDFPGKQ
ncbi:MAG: fucose isomerase [Bacteroidota bacterium]